MTLEIDSALSAATGRALDTDNEAIGGAQYTINNTKEINPVQLLPDLDQARRHLRRLDEGVDKFVFQTFDDNKERKSKRLIRILHGTLEQCTPELTRLQQQGAGVFVTVNHSSNGGRKKADIDACRAIFREADEPNLPPLPLEPHIKIESSPGKHHEYLFLERTDDFNTWDGVMNTMVTVHGSDPNAKDRSRLLRLAGFHHLKNPARPHMVRIVEESSAQPYSLAEVAKLIPPSVKTKDQPMPLTNSMGSKYGLAALSKEIAVLAETPEGGRNAQLNTSSYSLAQLAAGGELDLEGVETALLSEAVRIGLSETEALSTIKSGMAAGIKEPRIASTIPNTYHLTELGNAERFRDQHGDVVRYVSAWKKWILYDGRRWKVGAGDQVRRMAHKTVKNFYALASNTTDNDMAQKISKWAGQSCKSSSITAMLKEAAALLSIDSDILDADPLLFNCGNCTIDLKTGKTHEHRKEDWISKITEVNFDPDAKAPIFLNVLHTCFAGKQELICFVWRFAGYSMGGSTKEQCIFIWWGSGANGKSTILNALAEVLGDYAQTTRPETLMVKRGDGIPSDLAKLKGARLVTAAEAEDGHRLAESAIKQMTGGEKVQARALYQDWFEFVPEFKIILCTNHKPIIRGDDHAIWRRIRLVPFDVTIPEKDRDQELPEKLKSELPGILAWMVSGAAEWMKNGLGIPTEVKDATDSYQSEQNVIKIFLDSCCTIKPDEIVESQVLFQEFDRWRTREGHRKITQTKFGRMLSDLGYEKGRIPGLGRVVYRGIGLNPTI